MCIRDRDVVAQCNHMPNVHTTPRTPHEIVTGSKFNSLTDLLCPFGGKVRHMNASLGKLVTEKPVDFVDFDSVVKFNKNRQNDDNVVKAYKS